jgi:hypothetical protein
VVALSAKRIQTWSSRNTSAARLPSGGCSARAAASKTGAGVPFMIAIPQAGNRPDYHVHNGPPAPNKFAGM